MVLTRVLISAPLETPLAVARATHVADGRVLSFGSPVNIQGSIGDYGPALTPVFGSKKVLS